MSNTIKEFTEELARRVSEQLGKDKFVVRSNVVRKINTELTALLIVDKEVDSNITPQLYVNGFYHQYLNSNLEMDEIVDAVIRTYEEHKVNKGMDISFFADWEQVKSRIVPRLINREWNRELLDEVPHVDVLDLSICFYAIVDMDKNGMGAILVRNEHLDFWNVSEQELKETAFEQNRVFKKAHLVSMLSVMHEILTDELSGELELSDDVLEGIIDAVIENDCEMMVLTNKERLFGAIELLDVELLERISQKMESDLCLLGSSVHEILVIKAGRLSTEELTEMICTVNATEVRPEERLTNNPYIYKMGSKKIEIMQKDEVKL